MTWRSTTVFGIRGRWTSVKIVKLSVLSTHGCHCRVSFLWVQTGSPQKSIEAASFPAKVGSAMRFARRNCASCELEGRIYAIGGEQKFTTN